MKPRKLLISVSPKATADDGDVSIWWSGDKPDLSDKPSEEEYTENLALWDSLNRLAHKMVSEMSYSDTGWAVEIRIENA